MKKVISIILVLLGLTSMVSAFEIPENPDRKISIALLVGRKSTNLTYEYSCWRYLFLDYFPYRDTAKQTGTCESTNLGANIRIPWSPNITVDFTYMHINSNSIINEIPFELYEMRINEIGRDLLFSLRYFF
jgi:hypothetical protein